MPGSGPDFDSAIFRGHLQDVSPMQVGYSTSADRCISANDVGASARAESLFPTSQDFSFREWLQKVTGNLSRRHNTSTLG